MEFLAQECAVINPICTGGPHAGRLKVVCKTNEIKPPDYANLSPALLISFNCWCFSGCHLMIDILSRPRPPTGKKNHKWDLFSISVVSL